MSIAALVLAHEAWWRLGGFALALLVLATLERRRPLRGDARPARRQLSNLGLVLVDTLVLRLGFPVLAVGLAVAVHARGGGLLGALAWPGPVEFVLALLVFDLAIYWQHRLLHLLPVLWPLHRVHHSDLAFDVSTGLRFHPLEIALSMGVKLGLVWVLGPPALAVAAFELLLSVASLFTHADFALPPPWERRVRTLVVTPSMHRIHHSIRRDETDSNYGFSLSLWDRVFRSYRAAPVDDERSMPIGLPRWRSPRALGFGALLLQPFHDLRRAPSPAPTPPKDPSDA